MSKVICVASPYSGTPDEMKGRFVSVERYVATMIKSGNVAFSPIVHCHEMAFRHDMPTDFEFWQYYCLGMLSAMDEMRVLMLPGWGQSKGVSGEIAAALDWGIPVRYIDSETYGEMK